MRGINKVILLGTLGKDPEMRMFENGGSVSSFSIATSERWTDKQTGEQKEQTEWHRIQCNQRLAEIAQQYLRKGSKVYIEGKIKTKSYKDQNNVDKSFTYIQCDNMQMLDSKPSDQAPQGYAPQQQAPQGYAPQQQAPQGYTPQQQSPQGYAPQQQQYTQNGYPLNPGFANPEPTDDLLF